MSITVILFLAIASALISYSIVKYGKAKRMPMVADHENIKVLTDANFQQQIKSGVTLVDFWAAWCVPCKMMAPILNEVVAETKTNAKIGKINIEQQRKMAATYGVRSIPTLILFKDGKEVNRFVGVKTKDFLLKEIGKV